VELPKQTERQARKRDLYDLNDLAQAFFVQELANHEGAQAYLKERGFTDQTIIKWRVGLRAGRLD
jgi:DNA primase